LNSEFQTNILSATKVWRANAVYLLQQLLRLLRTQIADSQSRKIWSRASSNHLGTCSGMMNYSIIYKSLLRKHGVQVISINEPVEDTPSGKLLEGIIEVIDEFYSANLSQDVLSALRLRAIALSPLPAKHSLKMRCVMGAVSRSGSSLVLKAAPSFTLTLTYP